MRLSFVFLVGCALFEPAWSATFTTQPKDREVFVGEDVQFDWGYTEEDGKKVVDLTFGLVNGSDEVSVVKRDVSNDILLWNSNVPKSVKDRIKVKERDTGRKASMKIEAVQMTDKGIYFCKLSWSREEAEPTSEVSLQVVDLLITGDSNSRKESWKGHEILVNCAVKVADQVNSVRFTWKRETKSGNKTLQRDKHVDTKTQSELTLVTNEEEDFNDLLCIAKTPSTEKVHRITIRRLYLPDPPQNLKEDTIFDKGYSINRVHWEKPRNNGGSDIYKYVVQYKPDGIDWSQAKEGETKDVEFKQLDLKYGKTYNVHVRAINRVGQSKASNVVDVQLADPDTNQARSKALGVQLVSYNVTTLLTWCFVYVSIMKLFFA